MNVVPRSTKNTNDETENMPSDYYVSHTTVLLTRICEQR